MPSPLARGLRLALDADAAAETVPLPEGCGLVSGMRPAFVVRVLLPGLVVVAFVAFDVALVALGFPGLLS